CSSPNDFPGLAAVARGPNASSTPLLPVRAGARFYDSAQGNPFCQPGLDACRWGDYAGAAVDPAQPTEVVVEGELMSDAADPTNWGTELGRVTFSAGSGPVIDVPGPPTAVTAAPAGSGAASVSWSPPANTGGTNV